MSRDDLEQKDGSVAYYLNDKYNKYVIVILSITLVLRQ